MVGNELLIEDRFPNLEPLGGKEGESYPATDEEAIHMGKEALKDPQFVRGFFPANKDVERPARVGQKLGKDLNLFFHEETRVSGKVFSYPYGGSMGPMRCGKSIVHKNIERLSQSLGKFGIVLLLLGMETHVLQHQDFPGLQGFHRFPDLGSHAVREAGHWLSQKLT
jgi:hypothetical protein